MSAEVQLKVLGQLFAEATRVESVKICHGAMRRQDDQARIAHVHQRCHDEFVGRVWVGLVGGGAAFVTERQRGLVTVMSVRDIEFRVTQGFLRGLDRRRGR